MEKLMKVLFALTLAAFVVLGIAIVLSQLVCLVLGNGAASAAISDTLEPILIALSGTCALISFLFLLIFRGGFKKCSED